jgi:hypothetical protein
MSIPLNKTAIPHSLMLLAPPPLSPGGDRFERRCKLTCQQRKLKNKHGSSCDHDRKSRLRESCCEVDGVHDCVLH